MREALRQAALGLGRTAPNPAVGCVILNAEGVCVAEGYHARAGEPHAEAVALQKAGLAAAGGTLYVTLEPCSHWGRTPPCADAIIRAGIARVVAAIPDPDPRVCGQGFARLKSAGVEVVVGIGAAPARRLNEAYLKVKQTGLPFVLLKMAMTLDGRIATRSGDSRWITSPAARAHVQQLRDRCDAVMVGIGTVIADDPRLTVRSGEIPDSPGRTPRSPTRVILDSRARISLEARALQPPGRRLVIVTPAAPASAVGALENAGAEVITVPEKPGIPEDKSPGERDASRVDLPAALRLLAERGLHSILLEGGAEVAAGALAAGLVDRVLFFIAPRILGDREAPGPVGGGGPLWMRDARETGRLRTLRFGPDIAIETDLL